MYELLVGVMIGIGLLRTWYLIADAMRRDIERPMGAIGFSTRDIKRGEIVQWSDVLTSGTVVVRPPEE